jgi:hypothetical protein
MTPIRGKRANTMAQTTSISTSSLFTVTAETSNKLAKSDAKAHAAEELRRRREPQTPATLARTFAGIESLLDKVIVAKFVAAGIVDGNRYLTVDGTPTNDEEEGESMNPNFMKIVADGRKAWRSLDLINEELYNVTNTVWSSRDKKGTLVLPGFNDGTEGAAHRGKRFTVTEAGALAAMLFGTKEDRASGLFFKHFIVQEIRRQHDAYMKSPEARKVAEEAKARRVRQDVAHAKAQSRAEEQANYQQFKAQVPTVASPVISADAGLKVASDGTLRQKGRFTKKGQTLA